MPKIIQKLYTVYYTKGIEFNHYNRRALSGIVVKKFQGGAQNLITEYIEYWLYYVIVGHNHIPCKNY